MSITLDSERPAVIVPECRTDAHRETFRQHVANQNGAVSRRIALFQQQTAAAGATQRNQPQRVVAQHCRHRVGGKPAGGQA